MKEPTVLTFDENLVLDPEVSPGLITQVTIGDGSTSFLQLFPSSDENTVYRLHFAQPLLQEQLHIGIPENTTVFLTQNEGPLLPFQGKMWVYFPPNSMVIDHTVCRKELRPASKSWSLETLRQAKPQYIRSFDGPQDPGEIFNADPLTIEFLLQ
jgi:hypothetical protein